MIDARAALGSLAVGATLTTNSMLRIIEKRELVEPRPICQRCLIGPIRHLSWPFGESSLYNNEDDQTPGRTFSGTSFDLAFDIGRLRDGDAASLESRT